MARRGEDLFDALNRQYWRGRLPRYRVVRVTNLLKKQHALGQCDWDTKRILIDAGQTGENLRLTLLHEMCHVGIGARSANGHGPRFLRKLHRLVRLGVTTLVEEDIEHYDGTRAERTFEAWRARGITIHETTWTKELASDLDAMAESDAYRHRWTTVRRYFARKWNVTEGRIQRLTWPERTWRRLRAERYADERAKQKWEQIWQQQRAAEQTERS